MGSWEKYLCHSNQQRGTLCGPTGHLKEHFQEGVLHGWYQGRMGVLRGPWEEEEEVRSKLRHLWFTRLLRKGPRTHPGGQGDRMPEGLSGLVVCRVYSEHFPEGVISGHWGEAFCLEFKSPVYHMLVGPQFPHLSRKCLALTSNRRCKESVG